MFSLPFQATLCVHACVCASYYRRGREPLAVVTMVKVRYRFCQSTQEASERICVFLCVYSHTYILTNKPTFENNSNIIILFLTVLFTACQIQWHCNILDKAENIWHFMITASTVRLLVPFLFFLKVLQFLEVLQKKTKKIAETDANHYNYKW